MIILKHLFVIFIPSKTLVTSSEYVRKLANFVLIYCWLWEYYDLGINYLLATLSIIRTYVFVLGNEQ